MSTDRPYVPVDTRCGTRCADCGAWGERTGHMDCQYPKDHDDDAICICDAYALHRRPGKCPIHAT